MYQTTTPRERFADGGLSTASGPKIIVMCYERLDRDITGAIDAIEHRQIERAHDLLLHAQDILLELRCMLDFEAWEHSGSLSSIYRFASDLLVTANVRKSAREAEQARSLLAELAAAFKQAAASAPVQAPVPPVSQVATIGVVAAAPQSLWVLA
ncbi:MAG: flagellar export chaperone FliS [Ilumatobacteraceae bacterium]